jgi:D-alanyl-D-alanine carboxypeptidase
MAKKFQEDKWEKMVIVSAYRSYQYQKWIKLRWCPDNLCAKAWYSEHQSWLAVDFWEASTNYKWKNNNRLKNYYEWLKNNASDFGFHNTYQKWLDIDWYEIEPWHWRYLWVELAKYLENENITFAEYYKKNLSWKD